MDVPDETVPFGNITGETLDFRFEMKGSFKIASFSWRSSREGLEMAEDEDDDEVEMTDRERRIRDKIRAKERKERQTNRAENRKNSRVIVGEFEVSKDVDAATPRLFKAHAFRVIYDGCHIYFRKTGGGKLFTFLQLSFSDVIIEGWECSLDDSTKERLVIGFNWCQLKYFPQSSGGVSKRGAAKIEHFCADNPRSQDVPKVLSAASVPDIVITGKD
jgi:type VI protein secretion system component Hcp